MQNKKNKYFQKPDYCENLNVESELKCEKKRIKTKNSFLIIKAVAVNKSN